MCMAFFSRPNIRRRNGFRPHHAAIGIQKLPAGKTTHLGTGANQIRPRWAGCTCCTLCPLWSGCTGVAFVALVAFWALCTAG